MDSRVALEGQARPLPALDGETHHLLPPAQTASRTTTRRPIHPASAFARWCDDVPPGAPVCVTGRRWDLVRWQVLDGSGSAWKTHVAFTLELALPGADDDKTVKLSIIVVREC